MEKDMKETSKKMLFQDKELSLKEMELLSVVFGKITL
jgi:hypothetical protein